MQIEIGIAAILLAFYLYLLVRKDGIARPLFFWIGLGGVALAAIAGTLPHFQNPHHQPSGALRILSALFGLIGFLVALAAAAATSYKGKLPFGIGSEAAQAPAAPVAPQAPAGDAGGNMDMSS